MERIRLVFMGRTACYSNGNCVFVWGLVLVHYNLSSLRVYLRLKGSRSTENTDTVLTVSLYSGHSENAEFWFLLSFSGTCFRSCFDKSG